MTNLSDYSPPNVNYWGDRCCKAEAEVERLQKELDDRTGAANVRMFDLKAEVERLRLYIKDLQINSPAQDVINENKRLRTALEDMTRQRDFVIQSYEGQVEDKDYIARKLTKENRELNAGLPWQLAKWKDENERLKARLEEAIVELQAGVTAMRDVHAENERLRAALLRIADVHNRGEYGWTDIGQIVDEALQGERPNDRLREALDDAEGRYSAVYQAKCVVDAENDALNEELRHLKSIYSQVDLDRARLRMVLQEISELGDVRADEAPLIARRALCT